MDAGVCGALLEERLANERAHKTVGDGVQQISRVFDAVRCPNLRIRGKPCETFTTFESQLSTGQFWQAASATDGCGDVEKRWGERGGLRRIGARPARSWGRSASLG